MLPPTKKKKKKKKGKVSVKTKTKTERKKSILKKEKKINYNIPPQCS